VELAILVLACYLYQLGYLVAIEVIPAALVAKEKWEDFVLFLQRLPVDVNDKKYLLIGWAKLTGVALTHDMVKAVLGELDERTRG